jgi:hypothetical protein
MEGREMKVRCILLVIIWCVAGVQAAFSEDVIGYIDSFDGDIEITRNGEVYDSFDLEEGDDIENYDLIRTLSSGEMVITIDSDQCPQTTLTLESDTTFNIEINDFKENDQTTLSLITGGLILKVQGLTRDQDFNLETEEAVMGVRGTSFWVGTSPGGDILVTCEEGAVECISKEGKSLLAEPGSAVEQHPGELFQQIPVKISNIRQFRQEWIAERIEAFKPNALRAIRFYGKQYMRLLGTFNRLYDDLLKKDAIITKWTNEEKQGKTGSRMEIMKEKRQLIGILFRIRRNLFIFERIYFRLLELQTYYKQGYGKGDIKPGYSVKKFFMEFNKTSSDLHRKVAKIRFIMKLYAKRNGGRFPTDQMDESDSDFFGDDEDF